MKPWSKEVTERLLSEALAEQAGAEAHFAEQKQIADSVLLTANYRRERAQHQVDALSRLLHRQEMLEAEVAEVELEAPAVLGPELAIAAAEQRMANARLAISQAEREIGECSLEIGRLTSLLAARRS
jgi:hypothetical protein